MELPKNHVSRNDSRISRLKCTAFAFCGGLLKMACLLMLFAGAREVKGQANRWEKVLEFSGYGTTQTKLIPMIGEKFRIRYQSRIRAAVSIDLLAPDGQIISHLCRYQNLQTPYTETRPITPGMEKAAFRVEGDINGWTVTVEQYIDEIAGWNLFKWRRDDTAMTQKKLVRFGMWIGDASEEMTQKIRIQANRWRITAKSHQTGRLKYEVLNSDNAKIISNHRLTEGESESWIYGPGEYVINCSSIGTSWDIIIDVDEESER